MIKVEIVPWDVDEALSRRQIAGESGWESFTTTPYEEAFRR